jgi:DNA-binding NarL/FixJ family response regulator
MTLWLLRLVLRISGSCLRIPVLQLSKGAATLSLMGRCAGHLRRILVADDHTVVRGSICALLRAEPDFDVVCDVTDGTQAVAMAEELQPDIVVLDIAMPRMSGFEAARRIRNIAPTAEILFLSQHDTVETIRQAFQVGGSGYVVKSDAAKELVAAVRSIIQKTRYVNARFVAYL